MPDGATVFSGFTDKTVSFFEGLKENNRKEWFEENRKVFDEHVTAPARAFVTAMGERLHEVSPGIMAIPKVDKSIFRIYRDTRFSKNKLPYKEHLAIFFWEGERKKLECPGFYFHMGTDHLLLAVGLHTFPKPLITPYREAVADLDKGMKLAGILDTILDDGSYTLGGKHYKRVPTGYDIDHPHVALLQHNGLYASLDTPIPDVFYSPELVDYCMEKFIFLTPLHHWLLENLDI